MGEIEPEIENGSETEIERGIEIGKESENAIEIDPDLD